MKYFSGTYQLLFPAISLVVSLYKKILLVTKGHINTVY